MADELASALRGSGRRLTGQRRLVLLAVEELGHATPDELYAHLQGVSAVNLSTVYRSLEVLEELGLVRHTHLSDRAPTYHSTKEREHFHLVCRGCGKTISVPSGQADGFAEALRAGFGFRVDVGHLAVFGWCDGCSGQAVSGASQ